MDGDGHDDGLVVAQLVEVGVVDDVGHGVEVDVLQHGATDGAVDVDVAIARFGVEQNALESFLLDAEHDLFGLAVHDAGHAVLAAQSLSILFPYVLAKRTAH